MKLVAPSKNKGLGGVSVADVARDKGVCDEGYAEDNDTDPAPADAIEHRNRRAVESENAAANALSASAGRKRAAIEANWRRPGASLLGLKAVIEIWVGRNGQVQHARLVKSSGDNRFDKSAELAVKKASPLPIPKESEYYDHIKEFHIEFNPDE